MKWSEYGYGIFESLAYKGFWNILSIGIIWIDTSWLVNTGFQIIVPWNCLDVWGWRIIIHIEESLKSLGKKNLCGVGVWCLSLKVIKSHLVLNNNHQNG